MMERRQLWLRLLPVAALLLAAVLFLESRTHPEELPARRPLAAFPAELEGWVGKDQPVSPEILAVLQADDVIVRLYSNEQVPAPIDLYMAFFESQRTGATIHSPQNCLPGAGWAPVEAGRQEIRGPDGEPLVVNRFRIAKGMDQRLVLYWYQSHGRVVASEYWAKIYLVADAIRLNRTDGALVRVTTPILRGEDTAAAEKRLVDFAERTLGHLDAHIPR